MSTVVPTPALAQDEFKDVGPSAGHLSASQVVRRSFRMAILLGAARLLGVEVFGTYALLLTVVEMVAIISGYGYTDFLTRAVAQQASSGWSLARKITLLRLIYVIPSLGLALLVLKILGFPSTTVLSAALLGATLVPRAVGESAQGLMKGLRYFVPLPWIELVQGVVVFATAMILLAMNFGLRGVIIAEILGSVAAAVVAVSSAIGQAQLKGERAQRLDVLVRSTFAFNIYPFIVNVYDRVDVVVLSKLAGNFATGIYSLPYRAFSTLQIIPYGIMGALLPRFSSSKCDRNAQKTCSQAMKFLYTVALLIVLGALAFARPVILLVLGNVYLSSVVTLQILVWAAVPVFLNNALNTMLLAAGREKVFLWTSAVCTVFNVSANLLLIPRFSFYAAAVVTVLTELLLFGQNCYLSKKYLGHLILPKDGAMSSIAFLAALAGWLVMKGLLPEMWAGTLAFAAFGIFAISTSNFFKLDRFLAGTAGKET